MSSEREGHATWRISSRTSRTNCTGVVRLRPWGRLRGWRAPPVLVAGAFRVAGDPSASTCPWRCIKRLVSRFTTLASHTSLSGGYVRGRAGGTRTPNRRFWRPVLYQLSYCPRWGAFVALRQEFFPLTWGSACQSSTGRHGLAQRVSLCRVCWRSQRQNFFISIRSRSFSLFLVVM